MTATLTPPATRQRPKPSADSSPGAQLPTGQVPTVSHTPPARGTKLDPGQNSINTHAAGAGVAELPADQPSLDAHDRAVGGPSSDRSAARISPQPMAAPRLADPILALLADVLDDLERTRIANENRLRHLTRDEADSDGDVRGLGMTEEQPDVARLAAIVATIGKLEHDATLNLQRRLRQHPLHSWVKASRGVGEKQAARLLAAIGDPYINTLHDRPRTVSELWAYCGYHVIRADQVYPDAQNNGVGAEQSSGNPDHSLTDAQSRGAGVAAARARGQRANWSANAKMRAYLVAESCMKQPPGNTYRDVYEQGRTKYADAVHPVECRRCGPKGKPAPAGSPLSLGHQNARALRLVSKAILRDLWLLARDVHGADEQEPA